MTGVGDTSHAHDVVAVEVTIDGMLVIADRMGLVDFPASLGIRPNIPDEDLKDRVWDQVAADLAGQGVLRADGQPHPGVAKMFDTLSRAERTVEGRWWRRDVGGVMVRFAVCRRAGRHVIAVRDGELLVLQLVSSQMNLAGMMTAILGPAVPAKVEPLTGVAAELAACTTAAQLAQHGVEPSSARIYAQIIAHPTSWAEISGSQRDPGGRCSHTTAAAGVLDSPLGRLVSLPRRVGGQLYGSFLPGTPENLQRALEGLLEFLPSGAWLDHTNGSSPT
jgi:hypothetical protein